MINDLIFELDGIAESKMFDLWYNLEYPDIVVGGQFGRIINSDSVITRAKK
jgi:hypothetical protein